MEIKILTQKVSGAGLRITGSPDWRLWSAEAAIAFAPDGLPQRQRGPDRRGRVERQKKARDGPAVIVDHDGQPWFPRWPVCGIPEVLYTDNGSDFTSRHLEQVAADLKIRLVFSIPGHPRGRGRIERFFSSVNQLFLSGLPGYAPPGEGASRRPALPQPRNSGCPAAEIFPRRLPSAAAQRNGLATP